MGTLSIEIGMTLFPFALRIQSHVKRDEECLEWVTEHKKIGTHTMKKLYAPWRSNYTTDTTRGKHDDTTPEECVFCAKLAAQDDAKNYIIARFKHHAVLLNLYPYSAGHLLIIPYQHVKNMHDLSLESRTELMELITQSIDVMKNTLKAEGVNVGVNLGKAAGAGIPSHLHWHVLPRWMGDTNFLPLLADTKAVSYDLNIMYNQLLEPFKKVTIQ